MSEPLADRETFLANVFLAPDGRIRATWRALLGVVLFVFVAYGAAVAAYSLYPHRPLAADGAYRFLMAALLTGVYASMWRRLDLRNRFFHSVGLGFDCPWMREMLLGTVIGFGLIAVCVLLIVLFGSYGSVPADHSRPVAWLLLYPLWAFFWGAIAEEMAFRGYPFQRMIEAWGSIPAICFASFLFGAVHLLNPHFAVLPMLNTMLIGAFFAVVYIRTGSLWLPWGLHFGWNFALGVIFGLPVSGLYHFAVIHRGIAAGPDWLTGGSYGLEASVTVAVIVLLSTIAAWLWWPQNRQNELVYGSAESIKLNQSS